jgi:hypothetical protein
MLRKFTPAALALTALALPLAACQTMPDANPQERFWQALTSHCGKAYAGRLVSTEAADAEMRGVAMVMELRECSDERIAIPFHVQRADGSWDRSRTWLVTRTATGIRLKHDHRHEDGSPDAVTMYGGDSLAGGGTSQVQDFPVDAESVALFRANGLDQSVTNVWRVEIDPAGEPGAIFAYQLSRQPPASRMFRVEFDARRPIAAPPAPWR